jgi:AcrR family transcriptional regulator
LKADHQDILRLFLYVHQFFPFAVSGGPKKIPAPLNRKSYATVCARSRVDITVHYVRAERNSMQRALKPGRGDVEGRILTSATGLFAKFGYNGVSIRDIATHASVNEVTIYRHFPRKRDLYVAVLASELQQVKLGGDLLVRIAEASDAKAVLKNTFELISETLLTRPELLRLIQYSALEMGQDLDSLMHKHLSQLVEVLARYLEPWVLRGELRCASGKTLVLSLVGITLSHRSLDRLFLRDGSSPQAMFTAFAESMALGHDSQPTPSPVKKAGENLPSGPFSHADA